MFEGIEEVDSFSSAESYVTGILSGLTTFQWLLIVVAAVFAYRWMKARNLSPIDLLGLLLPKPAPVESDEVVAAPSATAAKKSDKQKRASQWETALRMTNSCIANGDAEGVVDVISMLSREAVTAARANAQDGPEKANPESVKPLEPPKDPKSATP